MPVVERLLSVKGERSRAGLGKKTFKINAQTHTNNSRIIWNAAITAGHRWRLLDLEILDISRFEDNKVVDGFRDRNIRHIGDIVLIASAFSSHRLYCTSYFSQLSALYSLHTLLERDGRCGVVNSHQRAFVAYLGFRHE